MGRDFFPLDELLALLPTAYSPFLVEAMVRLGARLPFAQVADEMRLLFRVSVSADTVRRLTEEAGAIQVRIEQRELERLEREAPPEREGPAAQQLSADGVMVRLTDGAWTEVRTISLGVIEERQGEAHATNLSYFSRRCSADAFIRQATLPTAERGTRSAETVVAVMDGASWLQELIVEQCPDAVRIPGTHLWVFPHAVGYLTQVAHAVFGAESQEAARWLDEWASKLKSEEPEMVLAAVRALPTPSREAARAKRTALRYLGQRLEQIRYAAFQAQGYPIGSGIVESAGKLVVGARLNGSGMHWEDRNLNPMLALRGRLCSGQWEEVWPGIWREWRARVRQRQRERRVVCQAQHAADRALQAPAPPPPPKRKREKTIVGGRPTAAHPWKQPTPQAA